MGHGVQFDVSTYDKANWPLYIQNLPDEELEKVLFVMYYVDNFIKLDDFKSPMKSQITMLSHINLLDLHTKNT